MDLLWQLSVFVVAASLCLFKLVLQGACDATATTFNVVDYGAVGDGVTDDTRAFIKTWNDTCKATSPKVELVVPQGKTFLVHLAAFYGPCTPTIITFTVDGIIVAPNDTKAWKKPEVSRWLIFQDLTGFHIGGTGKFDGRGEGWWNISCRYHEGKIVSSGLINKGAYISQPFTSQKFLLDGKGLTGCTSTAPTSISLIDSHEVSVSGITIANSPQTHILILGTNNVRINHVTVNSPGTTPNTDGIHLQDSHDVLISNANISAGDDCISIGDRTSLINITYVNCSPGHGISIGSLGRGGGKAQVENITVQNCGFYGTTNGLRIKTYQVGKGFVRGVTFRNLTFNDAENPIIIDQHYCEIRDQCAETTTGVLISDVTYLGSRGTSKTEVAIRFNCTRSAPCTNIRLEDIDLSPSAGEKQLLAKCEFARGEAQGVENPKSCLRP